MNTLSSWSRSGEQGFVKISETFSGFPYTVPQDTVDLS